LGYLHTRSFAKHAMCQLCLIDLLVGESRLRQNMDVKVASLEQIFAALNRSGCRYLVVGGVAVIAHGYVRTTDDLDLVIDLDPLSARCALTALQTLGYRPRIPVDLLEFADPEVRQKWKEEKGLIVFNVFSPLHPEVSIDLFPAIPFSFDEEYNHALRKEFAPGLLVSMVCLETLIDMKRAANRPHDQVDLHKLETLRDNR